MQGLLFSEKQISAFAGRESQHVVGDSLSLFEVSRLLGITKNAVNFLVKKQLLQAERLASAPLWGLRVTRNEFDRFSDRYQLIGKIASEHKTSSNNILSMLETRKIYPVSGPKVDGGCVYLYEKRELRNIDFALLIAKNREESANKPHSQSFPSILDEVQAADFLELDVGSVRQLAQSGALKTHKRLSPEMKKERKYYFSRYIIEKYKDRAADHTGLIAFLEAAKLFDLYPENFYKKYVKTGRLKPTLSEGRRSEYFFRAEDVEALLEIEKQTVITPEVAAILGVNISCVNKMIASSTLKPISGPMIDGFGKNLFLRNDVEKVRSERKAFKAKCLRQGKTARYGHSSRPRRHPIQDKIGPRIEELIKEWSTGPSTQRISGPRLYRQLINEGYQVGIVTVYVYLRQRYLSSAQAA